MRSGPLLRLLGTLAPALLLGLGVPSAVSSQIVRGVLVDTSTAAPVEGGIVWLLDASDRQHARQLTGRAGTFELRAPGPGRYRIQAERIGYARATSAAFDVGAGETLERHVEIRENPVSLEGITVEGRQRCVVRPEAGAAAAELWERARLALTATALTSEARALRFEMTRWRRELDPSSLAVVREEREVTRGVSENPIRSAPAEELQERGYVRPSPDGGYAYFAPDADVLLSDAFLDGHCFTVEEGEDEEEGLLGLAFQPVPGRSLPDVRGTLWLDPATGELRRIDLDYTDYPYDVPRRNLGARIEFAHIPGGAWIVRRWWIRMPRAGLHRSWFSGREVTSHRLLAIIEEGGEVALPEAARQTTVRGAVVSGTVVDSMWITRDPTGRAQTRGMEGARVFLEGTDRGSATDAEGRFRIQGVPDGTYGVRFEHPRLDSLALDAPRVEVTVRGGTSVVGVLLAMPSTFSLLDRSCPEREPETGAVVGQVVDRQGRAVPEATVEVRWSLFRLGPHREDLPFEARENVEGLSLETDERGRFRLCGLPPERTLRLRARLGEEEGAEETLDLLPEELVGRILRLGGRR